MAETDPNTATVPLHKRTFATSNYKRFYVGAMTTSMQHKLLGAVENVLTLYARRINALTDDRGMGVRIDFDVMEFMRQLQEFYQ